VVSKRRQQHVHSSSDAALSRTENESDRAAEGAQSGEDLFGLSHDTPARAQVAAEGGASGRVAIQRDRRAEGDAAGGGRAMRRFADVVLEHAATRRAAARERRDVAAERAGTVQARLSQLREARNGDRAVAAGAVRAAAVRAADGYERAARAHDELARIHDVAAALARELGRDDDERRHRERAARSREQAAHARGQAARHRAELGERCHPHEAR
jgi:hypothetical protein